MSKGRGGAPTSSFGRLILLLVLGVVVFAISSYLSLYSQMPESNFLRAQVEELQRALDAQKSIVSEHVHHHRRHGGAAATASRAGNVVASLPTSATAAKASLASAATANAAEEKQPKAPSLPSSSTSTAMSAESHGGAQDVNTLLGLDTVLLVVCSNRPEYLKTTLEHVVRHHPKRSVPIFLSEDGAEPRVAEVVQAAQQAFAASTPAPTVPFLHRHNERDPTASAENGYYLLSAHFKWALTRVFSGQETALPAKVQRVIILEEDLKIAPDFFNFFASMVRFVDTDPTVLAASAWNDNGLSRLVRDPDAVYRSDFFPGLGWMMPLRVWTELAPKWPKAYWDDWLREPPQRQGRHTLRPEVCRTFHFGMHGVSNAQFSEFLTGIKLNDAPVRFERLDLAYLAADAWDRRYLGAVRAARTVTTDTFAAFQRDVAASNGDGTPHEACVEYDGIEEYDPRSFVAVAHWAGCMDNIKARVPRTAYKGVVTVWKDAVKLHIAPEGMCGLR